MSDEQDINEIARRLKEGGFLKAAVKRPCVEIDLAGATLNQRAVDMLVELLKNSFIDNPSVVDIHILRVSREAVPTVTVSYPGYEEVEEILLLQQQGPLGSAAGMSMLRESPTNVTEMVRDKPSFIPMAHENKIEFKSNCAFNIYGEYGPISADGTIGGYPVAERVPCIGCGNLFTFIPAMSPTSYCATCEADEPVADFADYEHPPVSNWAVVDGQPVRVDTSSECWLCTAHAPGSEVQVEKGKSCSICGRVE